MCCCCRIQQRSVTLSALTGQSQPSPGDPDALPPLPGAALTDAEWARVPPLLPPQRPSTGCPRYDHRPVLSGIVWVLRRRASWRAVPKKCGKWEMVYKRYQLWRAEGHWQRIAAVLRMEECEVAL